MIAARATGVSRRAALAVLGAALWLAAPPLQAAIDPFYRDLLHDGMQAYDRGEPGTAARLLRLACFGMLDEPYELAACLTRLAVAEGAAGNVEGFRDAFRRIVEVEDRFGAYGRADLPPEVRAAFEQRAASAVPAATLESLPRFKELLSRKQEAQIAALPPRERRRALEERLAKEPRSVAWNLALAELELSEGKNATAIARAEQAAAILPPEPRAICLRGLTRAAGGRCAAAVTDLESCVLCGREVRYATALLGCRVELGQWRQAEEQVRTLPAGFKEDRKLAALVQQVSRHQGTPAGATAAGGGRSAAPTPSAPPARAPAAGAGSAPAGSRSSSAGQAGARGAAGTDGAAGTAAGRPPGAASAAGPNPAPSSGAPGPNPAPSSGPTAANPAPRDKPAAAPAAGAGATLHPLTAAERDAMARAERLLTANNTRDLREALRLARELADAHPDFKDAQYLAGEAAYRNSRWIDAADYFKRAGQPGDDRPELLFYMAVALYQVGDQAGAAAALRRSLPNLQRTPYVQEYVKRILGE
jgi:tetratricopeptide (TPR) repeat protein